MIIGLRRWTPEVTWSGGAWQSAYPVSNLGIHSPLARVARSDDAEASSTRFLGTLPTTRPVRVVGLVRHNLSLTAKVWLRIWADSGRTILSFDSGWFDVWPVVYPPPETLDWEDDRYWLGRYGEDEIGGISATLPIWLGGIKAARVIRIDIDDEFNPAGYVQIGLCEIAQGWELSVGPAYGYAQGWRFRSEGTEALGGVKYFDRRDKPRIVRCEVPYMPRDESMAKAYELLRQYDLDMPYLIVPFPDEVPHILRTAMLVRSVDPGLIARATHARDRVPLAFEEVL